MWACSCLRRFPACTLSWLPWLPHVHDRFVEAGTQYFIVVDGQSHTSGDFNLTLQLSVSLGLQGGGRGGGGASVHSAQRVRGRCAVPRGVGPRARAAPTAWPDV